MKKLTLLFGMFAALALNGQIVNENFNSSDGGWFGSSDSGSPYWEWGVPAGTQINNDNGGGGSAWVTGLSGEFIIQDFEVMYLISDAYDLSALSTEGSVSVAINYDLGTFNPGFGDINDGAILEYSLDDVNWNQLGSGGSGANWYDPVDDAWVLNSGGWVTASHELPMEVLGQSTVYFRFVFFSGVSAGPYGAEGFAMDDFQIFSSNTGGGGSSGSEPGTKQILTMSLGGELFPAVVDSTSSSVKLFVTPGTEVTSLAPTFTVSDGATANPISGSTQDFSSVVTYTITAADGLSSTDWSVSAEVPEVNLSVYPSSGLAGTTVTILGRGFSTTLSENILALGGVSVPVESATSTKLTFQVPSDAPVGSNAISLSVNGLNTSSGTTFNVLASNVSGVFADYKEADFNLNASDFVNSMQVGDIDNDGDVDLIFDNQSILNIATLENGRIESTTTKVSNRNSGTSSFNDITLVDVDRDGFLDIVAGGRRVGWYRNNGDGTWADESIIHQSSSNYSLKVLDVDGDFDFDILAYDNSTVYSLTNDGNGSFGRNDENAPRRLGPIIDWDEDGDLDVLISGPSNQNIVISANDGIGNFVEETLVTRSSANLSNFQIGDLDNDGDFDFVIGTENSGTSTSTLAYILNNGDGTFTSETNFITEAAFTTERFELADLNNDGFLDVARTRSDASTNSSHVYFSNGSLNYSTSEVFDSSSGGLDLVLVDVDSDGDMDVLHEASQSGGYFPLFIKLLQNADINSFSVAEETSAATIDVGNATVSMEVSAAADITTLAPTIGISPAASISPTSATEQDFSSPVTYTVTAEDGVTTKDWTVTVVQVPPVPSPTLGTIEQTIGAVSWDESTAASGYELELSLAEDFATVISGFDPLVINSGSGATAVAALENLTVGTTYYYRVRAKNSLGTYSDYSTTASFVTKPGDPALVDVSLSDIGQDTVKLTWVEVGGVVSDYSVEVSLSQTFTTLVTGYPANTTSALLHSERMEVPLH